MSANEIKRVANYSVALAFFFFRLSYTCRTTNYYHCMPAPIIQHIKQVLRAFSNDLGLKIRNLEVETDSSGNQQTIQAIPRVHDAILPNTFALADLPPSDPWS
jgi:hypothetical protein